MRCTTAGSRTLGFPADSVKTSACDCLTRRCRGAIHTSAKLRDENNFQSGIGEKQRKYKMVKDAVNSLQLHGNSGLAKAAIVGAVIYKKRKELSIQHPNHIITVQNVTPQHLTHPLSCSRPRSHDHERPYSSSVLNVTRLRNRQTRQEQADTAKPFSPRGFLKRKQTR